MTADPMVPSEIDWRNPPEIKVVNPYKDWEMKYSYIMKDGTVAIITLKEWELMRDFRDRFK